MPDDTASKHAAFPEVAKLMAGKRGLIMGVANERSIAWGITQALHAAGAEMAFTYQGAAFGKRVVPLVEKLGAKIIQDVDVENEQSLQMLFERSEEGRRGIHRCVWLPRRRCQQRGLCRQRRHRRDVGTELS